MKNIAFIASFAFLVSCTSGPGKNEANVIIQEFVKSELKSPSSADFKFGMVNSIQQDGNTFTVDSYVDSQNSLGGETRTYFTCTVSHTGTTWRLNELKFEQ